MGESLEHLPESGVVFQDTSVDRSLTITVWLDPGPQTDLMKESGIKAMGMLRIYRNQSTELIHQERVSLSNSTDFGPGPTDDEVEYWSDLVSRYLGQAEE